MKLHNYPDRLDLVTDDCKDTGDMRNKKRVLRDLT